MQLKNAKSANILIISDNKKQQEEIISNIFLSRVSDDSRFSTFEEGIKNAVERPPQVIIICHNNNDLIFLDFIKEIRHIDKLKCSKILISMKNNNEELICDAFENGVDDFWLYNENYSNFAIKILKLLKENIIAQKLEYYERILAENDFIDKNTAFFTKQKAREFMKDEYENLLKESGENIFLIVTPQIKCKKSLQPPMLANAIKKSLRNADICAFAENNKFYIMLKGTATENIGKIIDKIQLKLPDKAKISAAAIKINKISFIEAENNLNNLLAEALISNTKLVIYENKERTEIADWLNKPNLKQTDFVFYKQAFLNKYKKIVTPVFFQLQTILQNRLFDSKITQEITDTDSIFLIEKEFYKSYLKIKYPGYSKISIDIVHNSPFSKTSEKIVMDLAELTETKIEELVQKLEKAYKELSEND